jgi:hypothetical protein
MSANRKTPTLDRLAYRLRMAIRSSIRRSRAIINQLYFIIICMFSNVVK